MDGPSKTWRLAILLHAFMAVSALPAGFLLVQAPDGSSLGLPPGLIAGSPFDSYLIPGLVLFIVLGGFNALLFILLLRKSGTFFYPSALMGLALVIWILLQAYWIGWVSFLQPFYLLIGLIQLTLGWHGLRDRPFPPRRQ